MAIEELGDIAGDDIKENLGAVLNSLTSTIGKNLDEEKLNKILKSAKNFDLGDLKINDDTGKLAQAIEHLKNNYGDSNGGEDIDRNVAFHVQVDDP